MPFVRVIRDVLLAASRLGTVMAPRVCHALEHIRTTQRSSHQRWVEAYIALAFLARQDLSIGVHLRDRPEPAVAARMHEMVDDIFGERLRDELV